MTEMSKNLFKNISVKLSNSGMAVFSKINQMSNEEKQLKRIYSLLQFMENNIDLDMFEDDKLQSVESIQVFFKILFCSMFDDRDSILVFQQIDSAYEEALEMEDEERIEFISKYADKESITNFAKEVYDAPYDEEEDDEDESDNHLYYK